jgi:tetratricopeptide (TPR) repeat protein
MTQNTTSEARGGVSSRKRTTALHGKSEGRRSAAAHPGFQHYEAAVLLLQQGKFDKALSALEKLLLDAPVEIKDRCRIYISTCQRQLQSLGRSFQTPEEHYDYAISLLNTGYYEEAREQLSKILGDHPEADYAFYGLAVLESITGRVPDCLSNLSRAIQLNPKCRVQARADNDFQNMADDPRFTELLYPEIP